MVDLTRVLTPAEGRDIETITGEILEAKRAGGEAILTIGRCLIEAKEKLHHGEWLPWLNERVEFSERQARRFMQLYRECSNRPALADLGATKALALLALPAEEREQFVAEHNVVDMTSRQLQQAIKERDEARAAAEKAETDRRSAEEARAKMADDMKVANASLEAARAEREQADDHVRQLEAQLEDLKSRPVDVAVETVVDQAAVEQARAEAVAGMQDKLDRAKAAKEKAEEKAAPCCGVLKLFTTRTCPNCAMAKEQLNSIGLVYEVIDAEEHPELAMQYSLRQAPTLIVEKDGEVQKFAGIANVLKFVDANRKAV